MKLKTLKDLEIYETDCEQCNDEYGGGNKHIPQPGVLIGDLKQEAIKWIKEMLKYEGQLERDIPSSLYKFYKISKWTREYGNYVSFNESINFIKHFANITEEELK